MTAPVRRLLIVGLALLAPTPALAADGGMTFETVNSTWTVAADGTYIIDAELAIRIGVAVANGAMRIPLSWDAATETLEIQDARIERPGEPAIHIAASSFRDTTVEGDRYFHEYSRNHRLLVTLPDVMPKDLLTIQLRRVVFRPRVPGGFMAVAMLEPSVKWDETNYTISVPAGVKLLVENRGFEYQTERMRDRVMHYLHAPPLPAGDNTAAMLGPFDRLPRFAVSTFPDWGSFARSYDGVLAPHAAVTPPVAARATALTQGIAGDRDRARVLYEWVRDTIRPIAVGLSESLPDPRDAALIMETGFGDSKDHAVLLRALLTAAHIPAEFVLVNAGDTATIAGPPNLRPMDHLILFLPKQDVYLDSTLGGAPFGALAFQEYGKPAVHLGGFGPEQRRIPVPPADSTRSSTKTDVVLGADGMLTGSSETSGSGPFGVDLRRTAAAFGKTTAAAATTILRQQGKAGSGDFVFDPPNSPGDTYKVRGTFEISSEKSLLDGGYFTFWTGLGLLPRPGGRLSGPLLTRTLAATEPVFCYPGFQHEELSVTLPPGREMSSLPKNTEIVTPRTHYTSHWSRDGQRIAVTRDFASSVGGPVCSGNDRAELEQVAAAIRDDLGNRVGITRTRLEPGPDAEEKPSAEGSWKQ